MADKTRRQPRCKYCGKFFIPDYRVKDRQKSCAGKSCRTKRKRESQKKWVEANPGYFQGRSKVTNQWRQQHPDYQKSRRAKKASELQDEIRPETPVKTLHIVVPGKWPGNELQDTIVLVKRCGCGFYVSGWKKAGELQDEIEFGSGTG